MKKEIKKKKTLKSNPLTKKPLISSSEQRKEWNDSLLKHYLVPFPDDFFDLYDLAMSLNPKDPLNAFKESCGIQLVGPYDVIHGKFESKLPELPLYLHYRFFNDPPEVVTILIHENQDLGMHWGYYRDSPKDQPNFVVCNKNKCESIFEICGITLYESIYHHLKENCKNKTKRQSNQYIQIKLQVEQYIEEHHGQFDIKQIQQERKKNVIASTFHSLGIVVPYNTKKHIGYRDLPLTGKSLYKLLHELKESSKKRSHLDNLLTCAHIANDECDFGTGLQFGLDLYAFGETFKKDASALLSVAYLLLNRQPFEIILRSHLKHRHRESEALFIDK